HTSDTVMRIEELPRSMVIVGGGFVATEFAHVFSALGVEVHLVNRSRSLLRHLDGEISERFTQLAGQLWDLHLGTQATAVHGDGTGVRVDLDDGTGVEADLLLVATGRRPNSDGMGLDLAGVEVRADDHRVAVDEYGRTSADG